MCQVAQHSLQLVQLRQAHSLQLAQLEEQHQQEATQVQDRVGGAREGVGGRTGWLFRVGWLGDQAGVGGGRCNILFT